MCLQGALRSIPLNLICSMTTFRKKCFDLFTPPHGLRVYVKGQNISLHGALSSIPFNLICNMTTFSLDLLTPPQGWRVCIRTRDGVLILVLIRVLFSVLSCTLYLEKFMSTCTVNPLYNDTVCSRLSLTLE